MTTCPGGETVADALDSGTARDHDFGTPVEAADGAHELAKGQQALTVGGEDLPDGHDDELQPLGRDGQAAEPSVDQHAEEDEFLAGALDLVVL